MEKKFWLERWESNEIGFNLLDPSSLLIKFFKELKLKNTNRIFVPLCGKSIDMTWLIKQGIEVVGVELSQLACDDFFKEQRIVPSINQEGEFLVYRTENITIWCGNFFSLTNAQIGTIDAVFDRAALVALPYDMRTRYAKHLTSLMQSQIPMLLITMAYNQDTMQGPPFSVDFEEVKRLYHEAFSIKQLCNTPVASEKIPNHLRERGLTSPNECAFLLCKHKAVF